MDNNIDNKKNFGDTQYEQQTKDQSQVTTNSLRTNK